MTANDIARGLQAKRSGSSWMAKCPAHDDRVPSLSIAERDGKVLLRCFAGCEQRDIIEALKARGLWGVELRPSERRIIDTYDYTDETGELLYQVVRYEPKGFVQRHPNGRGGWIWKKGPRQVLYRLPEVLQSPIVFIVEGEKDVETLRSHGFTATTNAGGAGAPWLSHYTDALRGREVILIPDADPPGRERAKRIGGALLGRVACLLAWHPDGAKDISEWFENGHSEIELIGCVTPQEVAG